MRTRVNKEQPSGESWRGARRWGLGLVLLSALWSGCDSGQAVHADLATAEALPRVAEPNPSLVVNLQSASARASHLKRFLVRAYDIRGAELAFQEVELGANAVFDDLPAGGVQLRAVGLDGEARVIGFSDVSAAVPSDTRVDAPPLTASEEVPPPATPGTPFLAFSGLPAVYYPGVSYRLEVSAHNALGELDTQASGSVSLVSSGVSAVTPSLGVTLNQGRASFPAVVFPSDSEGTVTFTASGPGYLTVISPTLPVRNP